MFQQSPTMLDNVAMFAEVDHRTRERAAKLFTQIAVQEGHTFVRGGEPGREFFVITSGHATVTKDGESVAALGPSDFFGEMALISHDFRNATVTSTEPMTVLAANRREFESLMQLDPVFGDAIRSAAEHRAD